MLLTISAPRASNACGWGCGTPLLASRVLEPDRLFGPRHPPPVGRVAQGRARLAVAVHRARGLGHLDRGYDSRKTRDLLEILGYDDDRGQGSSVGRS